MVNALDDEIPLLDLEDAAELDAKMKRGTKPRSMRAETSKRATGPAKPKTPVPQLKANAVAAFVEQAYTMAGAGFILMGRVAYGEALQTIAKPAGEVWDKLAKRHETLRKIFHRLMETSEFSELFWVHMPLLMLFVNDAGLFKRVGLLGEFDDELSKLVPNVKVATNGSPA